MYVQVGVGSPKSWRGVSRWRVLESLETEFELWQEIEYGFKWEKRDGVGPGILGHVHTGTKSSLNQSQLPQPSPSTPT